MRITQNTPDSFVVNAVELGGFILWLPLFLAMLWVMLALPGADAPGWVYPIFAIFPLLIGALLVLSPRRSQLVLDARAGQARIRRRSLLGYRAHDFDLTHVDCLFLSQKFDTEAAVPDARTGLLTVRVASGMDPGSYSVTTYHRRADRILPVCEAANAWLAQHHRS